jgi:hypothetical protein
VWTPQDKWQQRTGWRRVPLVVQGRAVRLLVRVVGLCRRVEWLLCVGWVDGWCVLVRVSGSCAVGFWLSESLRGVFTPARNGRLQTPTPRVGAC